MRLKVHFQSGVLFASLMLVMLLTLSCNYYGDKANKLYHSLTLPKNTQVIEMRVVEIRSDGVHQCIPAIHNVAILGSALSFSAILTHYQAQLEGQWKREDYSMLTTTVWTRDLGDDIEYIILSADPEELDWNRTDLSALQATQVAALQAAQIRYKTGFSLQAVAGPDCRKSGQ